MDNIWIVLDMEKDLSVDSSDFEGAYLSEEEAVGACKDDLSGAAICKIKIGERAPANAKDALCLYVPNHSTLSKKEQLNFFK